MTKKKNRILILIILVTLILSSCTQQSSILANGNLIDESKKDREPVIQNEVKLINPNLLEDDIEMVSTFHIDTNYEKLPDINPEAISELKLDLSSEDSEYLFQVLSDGYLCGTTEKMTNISYTKNAKYFALPSLQKFDKLGNLIWQKQYNYKISSGRLNNLLVLDDNRILFSVQSHSYWNEGETINEKSFIVMCDKDGNELWRKEFMDYSGEMLSNIFLSDSKEVIVAGQWRVHESEQDDGRDDIVITKLDLLGNIIEQKSFGGTDFENLFVAKFDENMGIIIRGSTQSSNGDFAIEGGKRNADFVACIDKELNLRWVKHEKDDQHFIYNQLFLSRDNIYVLGDMKYPYNEDSNFIMIFDKDGNVVNDVQYSTDFSFWFDIDIDGHAVDNTLNVYSGIWPRSTCSLKNGDIIIGCGSQNQGLLIIFDENGNEKKRLEDLKLSPDEIIPTNDGGFIVKAHRPIKTIPQPLIVSSIWYDMEVVITKYDPNYNIQWRKTYDQYKESTRIDKVIPFEDESVIVEK